MKTARTLAIFCVALLAAPQTAPAHAADKVTASAKAKHEAVAPGKNTAIVLSVTVTDQPDDQGKHWHIYPRAEEHTGVEIPTTIDVATEVDGITFGKVKWPPTVMVTNAEGNLQPAYEGVNEFVIPVSIGNDVEPGEYTVTITLGYQACATSCLFPTDLKIDATIKIDPAGGGEDAGATRSPDSTPDAGPDAEADNGSQSSGTPESAGSTDPLEVLQPGSAEGTGDFESNVFGYKFGFSKDNPFAVVLLLLFAFVGGFLLNLTPCVLPVIPIKIMGLTQSADDPGRAKILGVSMGIGILAFWMAIGAGISFVSGFDSISSLFQRPWFGIGVGLFIAAMGVGMLGAFTVELPQSIYKINPSHDSLHGAFLFGVMTAVLSTPCTAPFMGTAAAWATKANNPALVLGVFAAIALGMGWPYVLLSFYPKLVNRVPRTGPASELVKQVMGLLMLAVAAFFGGAGLNGLVKQYPYIGPVLYWWIATIFVAFMAIWLAYKTFQITKRSLPRVIYPAIGLALFAAISAWSYAQTTSEKKQYLADLEAKEIELRYIASLEEAVEQGGSRNVDSIKPPPWRSYTPTTLAKAKAQDKVTIVHFTADW